MVRCTYAGLTQLTMYITLPFIRLGHEKIGYMPSYVVLIANSISAEDLLQTRDCQINFEVQDCTHARAFTKALSQFCLFIIDIISAAALP